VQKPGDWAGREYREPRTDPNGHRRDHHNPSRQIVYASCPRLLAPADARAIVAFGDSITDGTAATMNGDDRWPDVLARRLHMVYGKDVVGRSRAKFAGIRIIGATLTSALGSTNPNHGSPEQDAKRKALNEFILKGGLFDGIADFDAATLDPQTGGMRAEFVPESTSGGPGDKIHPNRVGYLAMGWAIDLNLLATLPVARK